MSSLAQPLLTQERREIAASLIAWDTCGEFNPTSEQVTRIYNDHGMINLLWCEGDGRELRTVIDFKTCKAKAEEIKSQRRDQSCPYPQVRKIEERAIALYPDYWVKEKCLDWFTVTSRATRRPANYNIMRVWDWDNNRATYRVTFGRNVNTRFTGGFIECLDWICDHVVT